MKERPILFSAPMVRAILEGRKTQTRRIVKPQPEPDEKYGGYHWPSNLARSMVSIRDMASLGPYGSRGDRLWVRETLHHDGKIGDKDCAVYAADGASAWLDTWPWQRRVLPSIHLPRGLSRISLDVTRVRVERLHDISEEDAKAEGVVSGIIPADDYGPQRIGYVVGRDDGKCVLYPDERRAFEVGWSGINGAESWNANPFVWVVEFRRVEAQERAA